MIGAAATTLAASLAATDRFQDPDAEPLRARPEPYADDVRDAIDTAFAEDEALRSALQPSAAWLDFDRLWDTVWNWFIDLLGGIDGLRLESPVLYWLTVILLLLVLVGLLAHIGWTFRRAWTSQRAYRADRGDPEQQQLRARRHADWLAEARRLAGTQSYREAVHALVLSLLALLDERNVLHVARSWTLREITDRIRQRGSATLAAEEAERLLGYGRAVERATYARTEPGPEQWSGLERDTLELAEVLSRVPATEAPR